MTKSTLTPGAITSYLNDNPHSSFAEIGRHFGFSRQAIHSFFKRHPKIRYYKTSGAGYQKQNKVLKRALLEVADVGDELSRDIAIRALESIE